MTGSGGGGRGGEGGRPATPPSRSAATASSPSSAAASTTASSRNLRQGSPTSVEEELLSSVEKFGELLLTACAGGITADAFAPAGASSSNGGVGVRGRRGGRTSPTGSTTSRGGGSTRPSTSANDGVGVVGCCGVGSVSDRPASPTFSTSSRSSSPSYLNSYSADLFAASGGAKRAAGTGTASSSSGGRYQSQNQHKRRASSSSRQGGAGAVAGSKSSSSSAANTASLVHGRAFPPLHNSVTSAERFTSGTASDLLSVYFADSATRSMERFHIERGDDSVRFGRWTKLPMTTYRLDRAHSDVDALVSTTASGGTSSSTRQQCMNDFAGTGQGGRATPPASSLLGAAGGVTGSRRPTLRGLPPGGVPGSPFAAAVAAAERQSLSLLGDVPPFLLSRPTLERHGTFRTPVRVPAAGMSVTEVSIVQRLFHLGGKKNDKHSTRNRSHFSSISNDDNDVLDEDDDMTYVIESVLRLLDVPYSDRFRVVMRQTISTDQRAVSSEPPTIDECLACSIPLCTPHIGDKSRRGSASSFNKMMSTAILRLEFEIQFHRTCMYEDRIRKMLTKKINKLLLSWCLWAQEGWVEERVVNNTKSSQMCMGMPLSSAPLADCGAISGCGDNADTSSVASASSSTRLQRARKWQSLSKKNDSFLLWSMTDIDEQEDDIVIGDESSLASDMSNVGLHRLEWRNRSLTGKEHVEIGTTTFANSNSSDSAVPPLQDDTFSYRGQGIELCLSDDEEYTPNGSPRTRRHVSLSNISTSQGCLSPYGVEVVYVSDGSANSDADSPHEESGGGKKKIVSVDAAASPIPDLQNAPPLPSSVLKGRSRGGFNRRKNKFGQRKQLKALSEHSEADTSSESAQASI